MAVIHPNMQVWATFRTVEPAPELPAVLRGLATVNHGVRKYHADAKSEIRLCVHKAGPERVVRWLRSAGIRLSKYWLEPTFLPGFWTQLPDDCAGALLPPDGDVAMADPDLYWRIVPLGEPLYTVGRPEAGSEHSRHRPHVMKAGGIPIVSDELFATLRQLGAKGETGTVIYRGLQKASYDTVQPGYRRFLIQPEYEMPGRDGFEFLPASVPADFGVCSMLRTWKGRTDRIPGIERNLAEDRWYDIAVAARLCGELRRLRRGISLEPIFHRGGPTHDWVSEIEAVAEELKA